MAPLVHQLDDLPVRATALVDLKLFPVVVDPPGLAFPPESLDAVLFEPGRPDHHPLQFALLVGTPIDDLIGVISNEIGPATPRRIFVGPRQSRAIRRSEERRVGK